MVGPSSLEYAGDISVTEAWDRLKSDHKAQLIDVRTHAEWNFVGIADLSRLGRRAHCIEWQSYPTGSQNPNFVAEASSAMADAGAGKEDPVLLMCRSGGRSRAAAIALAQAGFTRAFNIAGGFEGDVDDQGHRGAINGWKASKLPWRQG